MPTSRRLATATAGAALLVPLLLGCGALEKAADCVRTADRIADSVADLQRAADGAAEDPQQASEALDRIDKNVDDIQKDTGDADVKKAVDHLDTAVGNVRASLEEGDEVPDVSPVVDAAGELTKVCTP
ncbi:hypothetical protein GTY78_05665 [Streptomyces sp. SID4934]|uniref:hypothetical protein n=1 Tax=Streptomyces TaxID=1883 RepID=UPI00081DE2F9|nr:MULTISPECIES: hypothetical protein [Streptomyces]MYQ70543.1 hypothetical protein [Streptomyces sp. SID4934]RZD71101.1 hypothetical protein C0Q57_08965 [Streptomyces albidoflavus]SCD52357.1 hypothetical protein GA0115237_102533 [Streptomyces sp. ScaeMP-6W]